MPDLNGPQMSYFTSAARNLVISHYIFYYWNSSSSTPFLLLPKTPDMLQWLSSPMSFSSVECSVFESGARPTDV